MAIIDKIKVGTTTYDIEPAQTEEFSTLTFNNSGSGGASGTFFDGTAPKTISYNTLGAMPTTGGTFSGLVKMRSGKYVETFSTTTYDLTNCGLDMQNSDIVGCNSIYFKDSSDGDMEGIQFYNTATTVSSLWCTAGGTLSYTPKRAMGQSGTVKFSVTSGGEVSASSYVATSDQRLKENITPYSCENSILNLPVYKYNFITDEDKHEHIGCLAQDLQKICPEIVKEDDNGYLSINESKLVYLLLMEVKELKAEIEKLKEGNN